MSEQIDAIFDQGVLKPLAPLNLPDQARVKVTVETVNTESVAKQNGTLDAPRGKEGDHFDSELEPLLFSGPTLPPDFSRADIYADHD